MSNDKAGLREEHAMAKMLLQLLLAIPVTKFGASHLGAAFERIIVHVTLLDCESRGLSCSAPRLSRTLKIPQTNVYRALQQLIEAGKVERVGAARRGLYRSAAGVGFDLDAIVEAADALSLVNDLVATVKETG